MALCRHLERFNCGAKYHNLFARSYHSHFGVVTLSNPKRSIHVAEIMPPVTIYRSSGNGIQPIHVTGSFNGSVFDQVSVFALKISEPGADDDGLFLPPAARTAPSEKIV